MRSRTAVPKGLSDARLTSLWHTRALTKSHEMQGCLAEGFPFVFGFTVYESFESQPVADTGIVPMPTTGEKVVGGHCVAAVGYDDTKRAFIIRNSWGTGWGSKATASCHSNI